MSEEGPKSAIEIAMEKLRARGDFVEKPLTDEQKTEIAEVRRRYQARTAELEINQESKMRQATTYEELESLREELAREKRKLKEEMEEGVRKARER